MYRLFSKLVLAAVTPFVLTFPSQAQTATDTVGVSLTVQAECTLTAEDLAFGTTGIIDANIDAEADLTVQCTEDSAYAIGLDEGDGVGATVASRLMTHTTDATETVTYSLYQQVGRTTVWGNTEGVDTVDSAAATGANETITIYGRVPTGQNVPTGSYTDTVTATIWYGSAL